MYLSPAHGPLHIALGVAFFKGLALVILGFAFGKGQGNFGVSTFEKQIQWNQRAAGLFGQFLLQAANFAFMQQQLTLARGVMVKLIGLLISINVATHEKYAAIADDGKSPGQLHFSLPHTFDFTSHQGNSRLHFFQHRIIKMSPPICYARGMSADISGSLLFIGC